ncbi:MAG: MFS transporter [Gammaproteobacteria bacterium]|nr:MFS transporter [Gammaproteobacteria bacterium]
MDRKNTFFWYLFIVISVFYAYEFFLRISPSIVIEQLLTQYHITATGIGEFASSYYLGYVLWQIPAGVLLDRYSFKWVMAGALLACVVGTVLFTLGTSVTQGILGRFILGSGSAFAFVGALTFAKKYLPEQHFTLLVALVISMATIIGAFGQVFATTIIAFMGWHRAIDGMATWGIFLALAMIVVPSRYFGSTGVSEQNSWGYIFQQFRCIIKKPVVWLNGIIGSLFYLPTSILAATWGVELFTKQYHFTSHQGSIAITFLFIGWALGGPFFGWIADKIGRERMTIGSAAAVAAALIAYILFSKQMTPLELNLLLLFFGLASSAQVLVWHIFTRIMPDKRLAGTASSFTNLLIMLSVAVWQLVLGKLINTLHDDFSAGARFFSATDLRVALISLPILLVVVIVLAQMLPNFKKP